MRFILITLFCVTAQIAGADERTLVHDGLERRYLIEGAAPGTPKPAILVLHGGNGTPERILRYARFGLARQGWVEVYPQGHERFWSDGRRALTGGELRTTDDLGFLRALLSDLTSARIVDPRMSMSRARRTARDDPAPGLPGARPDRGARPR